MIRKVIYSILTLTSLLVILILWPDEQKLPHLGNVGNETMESINGQKYSFHDGKIKLFVFFYTQCPDICPMTLFDLEQVKRELEAKKLFKNEVRFVSITLDPKADTTERLKEYAQSFEIDHEGWLMLRSDTGTTKKVAKEFNMVYKKNESGFVTHSTTMYLVDAENKIRAYHDMSVGNKKVNIEELLKHIELLASE